MSVQSAYHDLAAGVSECASDSAAVIEYGLTLERYVASKGLDLRVLEALGVRDATWHGIPAVQVPYFSESGTQLVMRYRIALKGDRFRWRKGDAPCLYGLHRLHVARATGYVVLVEGESDCHAAWLHNLPAIGIPGSSMWRAEWVDLLAGIQEICLVVEPDQGGERLVAKLGEAFASRLHLIRSLGVKDLGELHLTSPQTFTSRFQGARASAVAYQLPPQIVIRSGADRSLNTHARRRAWRDRRGHVHLPAIEVPL